MSVTPSPAQASDGLSHYCRACDPVALFYSRCHIRMTFITVCCHSRSISLLGIVANLLLCLVSKLNFIVYKHTMFVQERTWYTQGSVLCAVSGMHWGSWTASPENKGACCAQMDRPGAGGGTGGRGRAAALSVQVWSQGELPGAQISAGRAHSAAGWAGNTSASSFHVFPPLRHPFILGAVSRGRPPQDSVMAGIRDWVLSVFPPRPHPSRQGEQRERLSAGQQSRADTGPEDTGFLSIQTRVIFRNNRIYKGIA